MEKDYVQYGPEWEKEMMKMSKVHIIDMLRKALNTGAGIQLIAAEREKQIDKHGFTGQHHVDHPEWYDNFQLQYAATTLLMHEFEEVVDTKDNLPDGWDQEWFDRLNAKQRKERLIIAAALIAAELDRLETLE